MSDFIWETFDSLFRTVHRQDQRVVELEARVVELERRLNEQRVPLKEVAPPIERKGIETQAFEEFVTKRAA